MANETQQQSAAQQHNDAHSLVLVDRRVVVPGANGRRERERGRRAQGTAAAAAAAERENNSGVTGQQTGKHRQQADLSFSGLSQIDVFQGLSWIIIRSFCTQDNGRPRFNNGRQ